MKTRIAFALVLLAVLQSTATFAETASQKAYNKRIELITYLRELEPIVKNFPGNDSDGILASYDAPKGKEGDRMRRYSEIKRVYQEGLQYYFESNFVSSYRRFLEAQIGVEKLVEELSQLYVLRADEMLKVAMEQKNPTNPLDKAIVDISIEYGKGSYLRKDMETHREAPYSRRMYEPKEYHYVLNKYAIEKNMETGYRFLGEAKEARINALKLEKNLETHQKLQPSHRKFRIEQYFASINRCRDAKSNAINIYKLKYPYDNYYLQNTASKTEEWMDREGKKIEGEIVKLEGVTYDYTKNPYLLMDHRLQPVFDMRVPEEYRLDYSDLHGRVYPRDVETTLLLRYDPVRKAALKIPAPEKTASAPASSAPAPGTAPGTN